MNELTLNNLDFVSGNSGGPVSVYNYRGISGAIDYMKNTGFVAFVGIGDSNQFKDGHGWDDAWYQALVRANIPCYASELHPGMEAAYGGVSMGSAEQQNNNSNMIPQSYVSATISNTFLNDFNLNHDADANSANMAMMKYTGVLPSGTGNGILASTDTLSIIPAAKQGLDTSSSVLTWRLKYGTYAGGSNAAIDPSIRMAATPFTQFYSSLIGTSTGVSSIITHVASINASTVTPPQYLNFAPTKVSGSNATNPGLLGDTTTQFDCSVMGGNTFRYTYDGTGTNPNIDANNPAIGEVVTIKFLGATANPANNGSFTVTNSGANFFEVTNAAGVTTANVIPSVAGWVTNGGGTAIICHEVIDSVKTKGFRHTTLFGNGGQSSYDMVLWYTTRNQNAKKLYFQTLNETLNGGKVVIYIQTAANDTSESHDSYNGVTPGSSGAAWQDNISTLIAAIDTTWGTDCGFDLARLNYLLIPGHNLGTTYATEQQSYITAAKNIANLYPTRVSVFDSRTLVTSQAMINRGYYAGQSDKFHLRNRGYAYLTRAMFADMSVGTFPAVPNINVARNATTAYLRKASNLTGLTDLQEGTLSFVINPTGAGNYSTTAARILQGRDVSGDIIFDLWIDTIGATTRAKLELKNTDGASNVVLFFPTGGQAVATDLFNGEAMHILLSWNTVGQLGRMRINDCIFSSTITITSSGTPALASITSWTFFADGVASPANPFVGGLGEFWYGPTYIDLNTESNRRFFTDNNGNPKQLPSDGIVNGITPFIYFRGDDFLTGVNRGSGGNFTVTGTLTSAIVNM